MMWVMRMSILAGLGLLGCLALVGGCKPKTAIHVKSAPDVKVKGAVVCLSRDQKVSVVVANGWRYGVPKLFSVSDMLGSSGGGDSSSSFQSGGPNAYSSTQSGEPSALSELSSRIAADEAAQQERQLRLLEKKGVLINIVNDSKQPFDEAYTRYMVQKYTHDSPWDWEEAADRERQVYAYKPKRMEVTLPIGKALRLEASEELRNGSMKHRISYLVIEGNDLYVLRFITQEPVEVIRSIAEGVAGTLRIKA